ncbi:SDR family oxidoreductase [Streptomyces nitrosporeus]|uniref:SDR family oxidoreductase n=1 Tax=Streptomyces nitrosporeus TaxID=28894 RepID=A0A5J6F4D4_9ACTN|nr:SDR family oxidoreductase [Streptomyces nitrosporeus]QEU70856.1 SDR family oxidoreductase [Streptomyces nitrosporeus]GGZ21307.1 short-chain dehydrogenase [Streptomyces nitrosporeus]
MTKYAHEKALVSGEATDIGLAIAKRLVEGGASVLLTARTDAERAHAVTELGSVARVVTPSAVGAAVTGDGTAGFGGVGLLFTDAVPTARLLLPYVEDGGAIVLTAPAPCPDAVRALAAELAARGIRVNAVAPGCIEAPGSGAVPLPPLGRLGAAEEVARAALFLATEATFTTGARLPVDGGLGSPCPRAPSSPSTPPLPSGNLEHTP